MRYVRLIIPPVIFILIRKIKILFGIDRNPIRLLTKSYLVDSYSQYNEDLIIDSILDKSTGFYVDVGANDPDHLSNTKRFYLKGWRGINIEPQTSKINEFLKSRERDVNLNIGISKENSSLDFFELEISTLSSFSKKIALDNCRRFNIKIKQVRKVPVLRLENVLYDHLPADTEIDFLSIDTEGFDLEVLEGNNWEFFSPKIIIVEYGNKVSQIFEFVRGKGYSLIHKNTCNLIFVRNG